MQTFRWVRGLQAYAGSEDSVPAYFWAHVRLDLFPSQFLIEHPLIAACQTSGNHNRELAGYLGRWM